MICNNCKTENSNESKFCNSCGTNLQIEGKESPAQNVNNNPDERFPAGNTIVPSNNKMKILKWFLFTNLGVFLTLFILSRGSALNGIIWIMILGTIGPYFMLLISKQLAMYSYKIKLINPDNYKSDEEEYLYDIVKEVSVRAGLEKVPEVGIYESKEINAFAVGKNRNSAMVAFSTGLLDSMDEDGIIGTVAHEIAHITNGDSIILTIIQGVINIFTIIFISPIWMYEKYAKHSSNVSLNSYLITLKIKIAVTWVVAFF